MFFDELGVPAPDRELNAGGGSNTEQTARILGLLEGVMADAAPDLVLVYGDTNSTLAGALAAAQARVPVAHVEAGMRSFDRAMPEELNRVLTDHASDLLLCSTETAMHNLEREAAAGEAHLVGDVMADVSLAFGPIAEERSTVLADHGLDAGRVPAGHRAPRRQRGRPRAPGAAGGAARGAAGHHACCPLHPRTAARLEAAGLRERLEAAPRMHLLPAARLPRLHEARDARPRRSSPTRAGCRRRPTCSGVPCVTLRDTTEWVETVEAGWNTLVGLDARCRRRRSRSAAIPPGSGPSCTAGAGLQSGFATCSAPTLPGHERRGSSVREESRALGYWGPNLARNFDRLPGAELAWICDDSDEALERVGRRPFPRHGRARDLDELLADPDLDAVAVATPVSTHAALAERVLAAGKHCFVEKPLAQSVGGRPSGSWRRPGGGPGADGRPPARVPPGLEKLRAIAAAGSSATSTTSTGTA